MSLPPGSAPPVLKLPKTGEAASITSIREPSMPGIHIFFMYPSQTAAALISVALGAAGPVEMLSVEAQEIAQHLAEWDGHSTPDSVGAAAYHVFVERLGGAMFSLLLGEELTGRYRALSQVDVAQVVLALMRTPAGDEPGSALDAERIRGVVRESLRRSWLQLSFHLGASCEKWRWG